MARQTPSRKLRKREVVFAVSAGALAAAGAALILDAEDEREPRAIVATTDRLTYAVAPFEEVSSVGPQTVVIAAGETHSIRSEGRSDALGELEVVVEDGKLTIRPRDGFGRGFRRGRLSSATFFVTLPRLQAATLAGSGDMRIDRIEGERFAGTIAGSGEMAIGALEVDAVDFSIAGSGDVVAAGQARRSQISIAGSGDVRASGMTSQSAEIRVLGSGDVSLRVDGPANVSIMGGGDVEIDGNAQCTVSRVGGGDVRCGSEAD